MGKCPACGTPTETGDRFCPACGAALAGLGPIEDRPAGWAASDSSDEPELLGLEAAPAEPSVGRPSPGERRSPRLWLAIPAGVLVIAVALWAVGRTGAGPSDTADTAPPAPSTTQPGTDEAGDAPSASDEPATTETTADPAALPTYDADAGGPVLGRPIGWSLLIGDAYETPLERLDLDTGERVDYEGVTAAPVAARDGQLVLQAEDDTGVTTVRIVPLDDPAAEGIEILTSGSSFGPQWPVVFTDDGGLWLYGDRDGTTIWRLVRLRDGKRLDEVPAPSSFQVYPVPGGGPDVTTSTSGGVYRRDGTGYRLISPGRPITVHQGAVLVTTCSAPADCKLQWLEADTGEPVERPLPPAGAVPGVDWAGMVDDAGRFLLCYQRISPTSGAYTFVLFDGDRDRVIDLNLDDLSGGLAASPDGRYLAVTGQRGINLYDADRERWITVPRASYAGANVLFVANGAR